MTKKILSLWMILMVLIGLIACDKEPIPEEPISSPVADLSSVSQELEEVSNFLAESVAAQPELSSAESHSKTEAVASAPSTHQENPIVSTPAAEENPSVSPAESTASFAIYLGYERKPISDPFTTASKGVLTLEASLSASKLPARTQTAQDFLDWVKTTTDVSKQHEVFFRHTDANQKLLIPFSLRNDLEVYFGRPTVYEKNGTVCWDFFTHVSEILNENEAYSIFISPLSPSEQKADLRDYFYPKVTNKKIGTYKGLTYAYCDGYRGENWASSTETAAWFIKDGMLIRITAMYINAYKPWNNEWFDYFGYETVEW